jgi:hypothetical protein
MAEFKVTSEPQIVYEAITYEGAVEYQGENYEFRYHENDNGAELYILVDGDWVTDGEIPVYPVLLAACLEFGPTDFAPAGEITEIDDETVEDYI